MTTYPLVADPDLPDPRLVHIRSTLWGQAWPPDAPAFCGARPRSYWHIAAGRATCDECGLLLPRNPAWKNAVVALADGLLLVL
jgi:hypothetical protein